jgi:DNA-binding winged helix-turn-helix (wHTH) protein
MQNAAFRFADWHVDRLTNQISRDNEIRRLEPRVMDVLVALCTRANLVVSADELLEKCWGTTLYSDNPVHKTITQLRAHLGDSSKAPYYIETIRKRGYRTIAAVVWDTAIQAATPGSVLAGNSPFRGLQAFGENDAAVFFGRREATEQLRTAVLTQSANGRALVLVLGPSGAGKTSLVRAGLLPALATPVQAGGIAMVSAVTLDLADVGEHGLLLTLASSMLDWQRGDAGVFAGASSDVLAQRLHSGLDGVIGDLRHALVEQHHRLVLFVDRLEAILPPGATTEAESDAFFRILDQLARSGCVIVIVACRNDFYPTVARMPLLIAGKSSGGHVDVMPPTAAEIAQMIRLPAQAAGLSFGVDAASQARLDDVLCLSAVGSPDALPLLQYTLQELYRLRTEDGELRFDAFQHLGGIEGAIGHRAEEVFSALTDAQRAALPTVLPLLVALSVDDSTVTSRRAQRAALQSPAAAHLVDALVDSRLFVSELVGNESGFGVAHEALLRRWPRITAWITEHRELLEIRSRVALQATHWRDEHYASDLLLPRGKPLNEAHALMASGVVTLDGNETALIRASAQKARWRDRIRISTIAIIAGLALLAAGLGVGAMVARNVADERRTEAEHLMGFMLGDFADKLRPLGRLDLLDSVSAKALEYLSHAGQDALGAASLAHHARALEVIGEVRIARGDPRAAMDALLRAQTILLRLLAAHPRDPDLLKQLGTNAFWRGQIRLNQNNYAEAQSLFTQYRDYSDRRYALVPRDVDAWIEQSYAHNNLGTVALKRKMPREAAAEFLLSVALKSRALQQSPSDRTLAVELADSLSWVGAVKETLGELHAAQELYGRELAIVQGLYGAAPRDALWATRVSRALQHQAALSIALGESAAARADLTRSRAIMQRLSAQDPSNRTWQANLAMTELQLLRIAAYGDAGGTLAELNDVSSRAARLVTLDPQRADWIRLAAIADQLRGTALLAHHRVVQARKVVDATVQRLTHLLDVNPADQLTRVTLANTLLARSDIESANGAADAAQATCTRVTQLLQTDVRGSTDFHLLDPWVRAQICLGAPTLARDARDTLARIGYRDDGFTTFLSHPNQGKP